MTPSTSSGNPTAGRGSMDRDLGQARAAESYLRSVVEECELVRRLPTWGDPDGLRTRLDVALEAVEHRADVLGENDGLVSIADVIRRQARHVAADLRIRDWAEQSRPDLLAEWQQQRAEGTGWPAMAVIRNAYEHNNTPDADATAEMKPTGRVALRGSAGDLLAYLQTQFEPEPDNRTASPDTDLDIDP